jgi:peptidoglycan hydrolase-like protein with peptidoglycan-binding domain
VSLAAKQKSHRPGPAPALGLRAEGDGFLIVSRTMGESETMSYLREFLTKVAPTLQAAAVAVQKDATKAAAAISKKDAPPQTCSATAAEDKIDVDVKQLQKALKKLGHNPGKIDGIFGDKTRAALKRFQKTKGLPETGKVDAATHKALLPALDGAKAPDPGASKPDADRRLLEIKLITDRGTLAVGDEVSLSAWGIYSNGDKEQPDGALGWMCSPNEAAKIDSDGSDAVLTALKETDQPVTIHAVHPTSGVEGSFTFKKGISAKSEKPTTGGTDAATPTPTNPEPKPVLAELRFDKQQYRVIDTEKIQLTVIGLFSDGEERELDDWPLEWSVDLESGDPRLIRVDSQGCVQPERLGEWSGGYEASVAAVIVRDRETSLSSRVQVVVLPNLSPAAFITDSSVIFVGKRLQIKADANVGVDLTHACDWTTSDPTLAVIETDDKGVFVVGKAVGEVTITATYKYTGASISWKFPVTE